MSKRAEHPIRVALVGGSTAGPVVPLLAIRDAILDKHPDSYFMMIDVARSVGQLLAKQNNIPFTSLITGKFRRYISWRTLLAPLLVLIGLFQALYLLKRRRITHVIGAGGFVEVPVMWAAWLLRLRRHIHQQDVTVTLANILSAPTAQTISVTFANSVRDFPGDSGLFAGEKHDKITLTGNPCRKELIKPANKLEAQKFFDLDKSWPTVYIVGGGSGAQGINKLIYPALPELLRTVQIVHSTGRGKKAQADQARYHAYEFISRVDLAYAAADLVIARAGIGTITELSNLGKASIIIPMPDSHQENNAQLLYEQQAALVLDQKETSPEQLLTIIRRLLFDFPAQEKLRDNIKKIMPHKAAEKVATIVLKHD